jgi:uncharacterized protein YndB with AHSA1/START domain
MPGSTGAVRLAPFSGKLAAGANVPRYSRKGGSDTNKPHGARLDTEVTWTLTPVTGGTHLKMVHDGFVLPQNQSAYDAMSPGWGKVLDGIARVTGEG